MKKIRSCVAAVQFPDGKKQFVGVKETIYANPEIAVQEQAVITDVSVGINVPAMTEASASQTDNQVCETDETFVPSKRPDDLEGETESQKIIERIQAAVAARASEDPDEALWRIIDPSEQEQADPLAELDEISLADPVEEALEDAAQHLNGAVTRVTTWRIFSGRGRHGKTSRQQIRILTGITVGLTIVAIILALAVLITVNALASKPSIIPVIVDGEAPIPGQVGTPAKVEKADFLSAEDPLAAAVKASAEAYTANQVFFFTEEELSALYFQNGEISLAAAALAAKAPVTLVGEAAAAEYVWTMTNRLDSHNSGFGWTLAEILTKEGQYEPDLDHPATAAEFKVVIDVFNRWIAEKNGVTDSNRNLPQGYYFCEGDGKNIYCYRLSSGGLGQPGDKKLFYDGYLGSPYAS